MPGWVCGLIDRDIDMAKTAQRIGFAGKTGVLHSDAMLTARI